MKTFFTLIKYPAIFCVLTVLYCAILQFPTLWTAIPELLLAIPNIVKAIWSIMVPFFGLFILFRAADFLDDMKKIRAEYRKNHNI